MKNRALFCFLLSIFVFAAHLGMDFSVDCCTENSSIAAIFSTSTLAKAESHSCCKKEKTPQKCCDKTTVQTQAARLSVISNHTEVVAVVPKLSLRQNHFAQQTFTTLERPQLPLLQPPSGKLPPYILFSQNILYA